MEIKREDKNNKKPLKLYRITKKDLEDLIDETEDLDLCEVQGVGYRNLFVKKGEGRTGGFPVKLSVGIEGKEKPRGLFKPIEANLELEGELEDLKPASEELYNFAKDNGYRFRSNIRNVIKAGVGLFCLAGGYHLINYLLLTY